MKSIRGRGGGSQSAALKGGRARAIPRGGGLAARRSARSRLEAGGQRCSDKRGALPAPPAPGARTCWGRAALPPRLRSGHHARCGQLRPHLSAARAAAGMRGVSREGRESARQSRGLRLHLGDGEGSGAAGATSMLPHRELPQVQAGRAGPLSLQLQVKAPGCLPEGPQQVVRRAPAGLYPSLCLFIFWLGSRPVPRPTGAVAGIGGARRCPAGDPWRMRGR